MSLAIAIGETWAGGKDAAVCDPDAAAATRVVGRLSALTGYSLLTTHYSLLTTHYSLPAAQPNGNLRLNVVPTPGVDATSMLPL